MLIAETNKLLDFNTSKFLCVTRPRRFGKSMAMHMLNAYYSKGANARELFAYRNISEYVVVEAEFAGQRLNEIAHKDEREQVQAKLLEQFKQQVKSSYHDQINIKIHDFSTYLNKYDVICVDFNDVHDHYKDYATKHKDLNIVQYLNNSIVEELKELYGNSVELSSYSELSIVLSAIYQKLKKTFIILIDEWDLIFRDQPYVQDHKLRDEYVDFLRSLFKSAGTMKAISLAYLTGILPIRQYNSESSLNNFTEYSMLDPKNLASYFGFTKSEMERLCIENKIDFEQMSAWYDGYTLNGMHIYNPYSVVQSISSNLFKSYWTKTSASNLAFDYILGKYKLCNEKGIDLTDQLENIWISLLVGEELPTDLDLFYKESSTTQLISSIDQLYGLLINLGYLTYQRSNESLMNCLVKIPNYEVSLAFKYELLNNRTALIQNNDRPIVQLNEKSQALLHAIIEEQDALKVAQIVQDFHNNSVENIAILEYNHESALRFTIQTLMFFATANAYFVEKEIASGLGFADLIYMPKREYLLEKSPIIIELKMNSSALSAVSQIKEKNYKQRIRLQSNKPIYYVGIGYDAKTKLHECRIEIDNS